MKKPLAKLVLCFSSCVLCAYAQYIDAKFSLTNYIFVVFASLLPSHSILLCRMWWQALFAVSYYNHWTPLFAVFCCHDHCTTGCFL